MVRAVLIAAVLASTLALFGAQNADASANGGSSCALCTIVVALGEQTMEFRNQDPKTAFTTLCGFMPSLLKDVCDIAINELVPIVGTMMSNKESPDTICNTLGMCKAETAVCRLFPSKLSSHKLRPASIHTSMSDDEAFTRNVNLLREKIGHPVPSAENLRAFNICTILPGVCNMENHLPFSDTDGDKFSTQATLRGSNWRGKDCNDLDATVYPGRQTTSDPREATTDANCNGISGTDSATGKTYEELYCAGSKPMGVAVLGDSATAHFRIPPDLFRVAKMDTATWSGLLPFIENEADWPMLSWGTGHANASQYAPHVTGPMTSLYSLTNERNRCNHRDFQNLGVNGARVKALVEWVNLLARGASDKPIATVFSMVGNDVCNGHHTFDTMTTPQEYYTALYDAVMAADAKLPAGSSVTIVPLVDGRILYDTMHARFHPLGELNQDVTYSDFYDYLNCLEVSPCWGWMNSNETVRNTTYTISTSLNAQIPKVIADTKNLVHNIQVVFAGNLFNQALDSFTGPRYELIEPVDGFHPSQLANSIIGNLSYYNLAQAGLLGDTNPNNAAIQAKFGDQGGY